MPNTTLPGGDEYSAQPPWEERSDVPDDGELVTQTQHRALVRMVTDLAAAVRAQSIEIASLKEGKPAKPDNTQGNTLQSGKHAGKTRDWCVQNAPDYIVFLADSGWAESRWGFSKAQIEEARKRDAANPKPSR